MAEDNVQLEDGGIEVDIPVDADTEAKITAKDGAVTDTKVVTQEPDNSAAIVELRAQMEAAKQAQEHAQAREQAALRERAHLEQVARDQAERLARAEEEAVKTRGEMADARKGTLEAAMNAAKAEADVARRDYQLALEAGDFAKASDANWRVNKAASEVALLEREAHSLTTEQRTRPAEGAVRQQPQQRLADPVEAYIDNKSPRTQAWLRQHPETITDARLNNKTVAAHYDALAEGYAIDTEAYFNFIDRKLGFAGQPESDAQAAPAAQAQPTRKAQPPAAPVSRDAPTSRERNQSRMYLTKGEQEVAEALGITPTEYARRKVQMEKQGYYR